MKTNVYRKWNMLEAVLMEMCMEAKRDGLVLELQNYHKHPLTTTTRILNKITEGASWISDRYRTLEELAYHLISCFSVQEWEDINLDDEPEAVQHKAFIGMLIRDLDGDFDFSRRIKIIRQINGMTQMEVTAAAGVTPASFAMYETGKTIPGGKILRKLADVMPICGRYLI